MMALVSSDELAKDVTGAEALLERHQVRRGSLLKAFITCTLITFSITSTTTYSQCIKPDTMCIERP